MILPKWNIPEEIVFSQTKKINYLYTSDGLKLRETITEGELTMTYDYCSNLVFKDGELRFILFSGGRAVPLEGGQAYDLEYFLTDHLGNVRVIFGDPDQDHEPEVIAEYHYYPFGMTFGGVDYSAGLENRYLYQGKETTGDFGLWWSDFSARRFDSQLGRWHIPDPAGQFASPYLGMGNNPLAAVDPSGSWAVGGPWYWSRAVKEAEMVVANFRRQSFESYTYEEVMREVELMLLWNDILSGNYNKFTGIGQPEMEGGPDDPPGSAKQNESVQSVEYVAFGSGLFTTMVNEAARGINSPLIKTMSRTSGVLGGITGTIDNTVQATIAFSEGNYVEGSLQSVQATDYIIGTILLFTPAAPIGGIILDINAAIDIGEFFYQSW